MAPAAHILGNGHGGTGLKRTDFMFIVATGAGWRVLRSGHDRFAMHASRPVARLLIVTRAASRRLPGKINRRGRRIAGNHLVRIVTILARRRVGVAGLKRQAMNARVETFGLPHVTSRAVHRCHRLVVVGMFIGDIRVTVDAGIRRVRGSRQPGLVHKQRKYFAGGVGLGERVVAVTIEAVAVLQTGGRRYGPRGQNQQRDQNQLGKSGLSVAAHTS